MNEAARICARLIVAGAVPRSQLPELDHPAIRADVEEKLLACGLCLASSAYSDHYGVQIAVEVADATVLDAATNLDLRANACALLTILWARLALQARTAGDTHATPDQQQALLTETRADEANAYAPSIRFETLAGEFGAKLGGRTILKSLLGQLRKLKFVEYHHLDEIKAGPLLELGIQGEGMIAFIRSRVLGEMLGVIPQGDVDAGLGGSSSGDSSIKPEGVDPANSQKQRAVGGT